MTRSYINYIQDYSKIRDSLFLEEKIGLIETLRNEAPNIWDLYKRLKALDWSEDEINLNECLSEFKLLPKEISDLMIKTLAWQFEADSSASNIYTLMAPFVSNSELITYLIRLSDNEVLHSLAYQFIVKNSFEKPDEFIQEIIKIEESFRRLNKVKSVFDEVYEAGLKYSLGELTDKAYLRKLIIKFWVTLLCLERIQFISSFAITFGLAEQGYFVPIAKLVQKICTDEFQIHVQADKEVLKHELNINDNFALFLDILQEVKEIIREIVESELNWLDYLFGEKEEIAKIRKSRVKQFVLYCANDVYKFLQIENPFDVISNNPLPYMEKWIVIDNNQAAPQEENVANYLLGGYIDDSGSVDYSKYQLSFN